MDQVNDDPDKENFTFEQMGNTIRQNREMKLKKSSTHGATVKQKMTKEERTRMLEEKKLKKEASTFFITNFCYLFYTSLA